MHSCPLCLSSKTEIYSQINHAVCGRRVYWRCTVCDLIFLQKDFFLFSEEEKERYDLHQNFPSDNRYRAFLNKLLSPLMSKLTDQMTGLDYGCGPGPAVCEIMGEKGVRVHNYDPFYAPQTDVLKGQYDFITLTEVMEHFFFPRAEFSRLNGLLKSNGFLGAMTQVFSAGTKFEQWWYSKDPTHVCFYQDRTLEWIACCFNWKMERPDKNVIIYSK